jgi:hypothetical protein
MRTKWEKDFLLTAQFHFAVLILHQVNAVPVTENK